jgi:hypothetical protein
VTKPTAEEANRALQELRDPETGRVDNVTADDLFNKLTEIGYTPDDIYKYLIMSGIGSDDASGLYGAGSELKNRFTYNSETGLQEYTGSTGGTGAGAKDTISPPVLTGDGFDDAQAIAIFLRDTFGTAQAENFLAQNNNTSVGWLNAYANTVATGENANPELAQQLRALAANFNQEGYNSSRYYQEILKQQKEAEKENLLNLDG